MQNRRGFTLVELLVVIAIIGVLIALLLPAVQQAREAARRMQCTNNLKQLGLAVHNYHDTRGAFPSGWIKPSVSPNGNYWGWGTFILPFIEQNNLYDQIDFTYEWVSGSPSASNPNGGLSQTPIEAFVCPTDIMGPINTKMGHNGTSNYLGSYGNKAMREPEYFSTDHRGIFSEASKVGFRDVTDGTSNTILFGEKTGKTVGAYNFQAGLWAGVRNRAHSASMAMPYVCVGRGPDSATSYWNGINATNTWALAYSLHPGGANFGFVDGSVHFLPETINLVTYRYLIQRDDGNVLSEF